MLILRSKQRKYKRNKEGRFSVTDLQGGIDPKSPLGKAKVKHKEYTAVRVKALRAKRSGKDEKTIKALEGERDRLKAEFTDLNAKAGKKVMASGKIRKPKEGEAKGPVKSILKTQSPPNEIPEDALEAFRDVDYEFTNNGGVKLSGKGSEYGGLIVHKRHADNPPYKPGSKWAVSSSDGLKANEFKSKAEAQKYAWLLAQMVDFTKVSGREMRADKGMSEELRKSAVALNAKMGKIKDNTPKRKVKPKPKPKPPIERPIVRRIDEPQDLKVTTLPDDISIPDKISSRKLDDFGIVTSASSFTNTEMVSHVKGEDIGGLVVVKRGKWGYALYDKASGLKAFPNGTKTFGKLEDAKKVAYIMSETVNFDEIDSRGLTDEQLSTARSAVENSNRILRDKFGINGIYG